MAGALPDRHAGMILAQKLADRQLALFVKALVARLAEDHRDVRRGRHPEPE